MIILGIDPGLAILGYGVIRAEGQKLTCLQYGAVTTQPRQTLPNRLCALYTGVDQLFEIYHPDEVAFEELFFSKNVTTGIAVGSARGVALVAAARRTQELYEYTPMQVKQAVTGHGGADKRQVQQMVKLLLGLDDIPRPDDAADALAIAITHAHSRVMKHLYKIQ